ncbi:hypothetical protein EJ04DRAFT_164321 [Polyplosphaeria fusca]|uniref:Uncharacterized protein n=1 Tax=Polyplosphaeria fusca TaxID=682080 RepID=A0A9P4RCT6_9PLEO|nr:hypothetical protein EJ04DRAFT_164321 [Polyplosphaeria fusca]
MASILRQLNRLLPFTDPNTPLLQDLIHTLILCGTLYFGPQIVAYYNSHRQQPRSPTHPLSPTNNPPAATPDIPIDENLVLQPDTDDDLDPQPPPLAPTPPATADPPFAAPPDEPGPANPDRPPVTPANRIVGAKKAKSLARKDQRRAYFEFHRAQAEQRKQEEARDAPEREAALAAVKARRAEVEREIADAERARRERRKEEERAEQRDEVERRERVLGRVREEVDEFGAVDIEVLAEEEGRSKEWVEKLVRAAGVVHSGGEKGAHIMITGGGWLVRIDEDVMRKAYMEAIAFGDKNGGKISFGQMGGLLEKAMRARMKA